MKISRFILIVIAIVSSSCSDFLDITPKNKQTEEQLYENKSGFYTAANGIYNGLASEDLYGKAMTYEMIDILAKRYATANSTQHIQNLGTYNYTYNTVSTELSVVWMRSYELILAANILMNNISQRAGILNQTESDIMTGEMLAVRAFLHFDLLRLFGSNHNSSPDSKAIPYNESSEVMVLPLLSQKQVLEKIITDLNKAEELLANDPVITNGPMASLGNEESVNLRYRQFRFNLYSVIAIKARVYLWANDKENALIEAKKILNDNNVKVNFPAVDPNTLLANYTNPDRIFSSEILAGIYVKKRDEIFTNYFSSETAGINFLQPYNGYMTNYLFKNRVYGQETSDYRYQTWWQTSSGVGSSGSMLIKYKAIEKPDATDENSEYYYSRMIPLIRLSEVYYIAAECEQNTTEAFKWLNIMRERRGLQVFLESSYPALERYIPTFIMNEYIREFYGEGQSFFYFKRNETSLVYENGQELNYAFYEELNYKPSLPTGEQK